MVYGIKHPKMNQIININIITVISIYIIVIRAWQYWIFDTNFYRGEIHRLPMWQLKYIYNTFSTNCRNEH